MTRHFPRPSLRWWPALSLLLLTLLTLLPVVAAAHGVADSDQRFIEHNVGSQIVAFIYLGAKHMVTGYDHLLFLVGVVFFLYGICTALHIAVRLDTDCSVFP